MIEYRFTISEKKKKKIENVNIVHKTQTNPLFANFQFRNLLQFPPNNTLFKFDNQNYETPIFFFLHHSNNNKLSRGRGYPSLGGKEKN